eukprot:scaffold495_cov152-Skeletonema_menzelii.AAC.8
MTSTKSSSTKNTKNNNSTRLPPKTRQKKKTGKAAKVNLKRILMDEKGKAEQLKDALESLTERLQTVLDSGGVPKERTQDIRKQLLLVYDICDASASLTEQIQNTIGAADPKADAEVLNELEGVSKQVNDLITSTKATLYMTHVRMVVFNQEEEAE